MADENKDVTTTEVAEKPRRVVYEPAVDMHIDADRYILEMDVPGIGPGQVEISVEDNVLAVSTHGDAPVETGRAIVREFEPADYYRSFGLGKEIDVDNISASVDKGVLTITLPKIPAAQPKKIEVKGAQGSSEALE